MRAGVNIKGIIIIFVVLFFVIVLSVGLYTIKSGNVGVLSTFGKFSDDIKEPGLHVKIPIVQSVRIMDIKMQTVNYQEHEHWMDEDGVINRPRIDVLDSKNLKIGIEITIQYTPEFEKANVILMKYGNNYFEKLINPIIRDIVRDVSGQYQAEDIAFNRASIGTKVNEKLQEKFNTLPFILNGVQLRNIDLPQIVRKKIEEVQLAKQEEQRLAMVEKQATKNQEIQKINANTKLIEITTQAKAEAEKKRIEAEAQAFQITKEAEAIAKANEEIAKSITPALIKYEAIKKWSGNYPKMLVSKENEGLLLQMPSLD